MMPGTFTFDEDGNDIVTLSPSDSGHIAVKGWVNIGEHAVELTLDANGGLCVECHAKEYEGHALASVQVPRLAATLARLRGQHAERAEPLRAFVDELSTLGFGGDDSISGADTVDSVNRHFDNLRMLADPLAQVAGEAE